MTTVTIGGPLKGSQALSGLIAATGRYFDESERLVRESLAEGRSVTFEDIQDYGLTPDIDRFCQAQGLSYQRAWSARPGVFEAGLRHWRPGLVSPVAEAADDGGEPMMTLPALRNALAAGETLTDLLARLDEAVSAAVPPLTLVDPELTIGSHASVGNPVVA
ncbi:hypothetical protein [Methylobacterium sp. SyP6R]|uniref:hypothetical protein n=1 Tax=Methylobacterium sp. SyP6R TaxID=2718876 RepID=UPI001F385E8E|nr:hypothetical protein [Methylobacterium sp. SyP6R]MCF4130099.1 hypothetical protein [Methylobacterium sp. SyP6R]